MKKHKHRKQIRKLVKQILSKDSTSSIYIKDINHRLQCPMEIVEAELYRMADEGILMNVLELRCFMCNQRITTFECPEQFLRCTMPECPGCYFQPESLTMNDLVNTFVLRIIDVAL